MRSRRSVAVLLACVVVAFAVTVGVASATVPVPPPSPAAVPMPVADLVAAQMPVVYQTHRSKLQTPPAPPEQGQKVPEPIPGLVISPESKTKKGWAFCRQKGVKMKAFYCPVFPATASVAVQMGWLDVVQCGLAVAAFIVGNAVAITKVKKAGGVYKFAKGLKRKKGESKNKHKDRVLKSLTVLIADLSGATVVLEKCA
jgi:hypothetical protein